MAQKLIYCSAGNDLDRFETRVKKAKDCGFTHVDIGQAVDRARWENDDPADPWLQWNMGVGSIFRVLPPAELIDWVPPEVARANKELVIAKGKILEKYGLRGVYASWDPTWMPECFFTAHPDWRGPRIDHPRRSVHKRFAPCMDHPEVLALYRDTVRRLVELVPTLDTFTLYSNDSGAGMCWSEYLYNGKNGPLHCKGISIGKRVAKFLSEIRGGALDAGVEAEVTMSAQFSSTEVDAILAELKPGTGLMDWDDYNYTKGMEMFKKQGNAPAYTPMRNIPYYCSLANMHESVRTANKIIAGLSPSFADTHFDYLDMIAEMLSAPKFDVLDRNTLLHKMAARQVGAALASTLMKIWELIDSGVAVFSSPRVGGNLLGIASVMERWINRPLVPFPLELTPEENGYYRPHQFQANGDARAADMMNCQDAYFIDSRVGAIFLETLWSGGMARLNEAAAMLDRLSVQVDDCNRREELSTLAIELRALNSIALTCIHICHFQTFMYVFKEPEDGVHETFLDRGDHDRQFIYEIYRSEIDNTRNLIDLLTRAPRPILTTTEHHDQEDVMSLSPNIISQLEKKIEIMMNHWQDFDRIFTRPNK